MRQKAKCTAAQHVSTVEPSVAHPVYSARQHPNSEQVTVRYKARTKQCPKIPSTNNARMQSGNSPKSLRVQTHDDSAQSGTDPGTCRCKQPRTEPNLATSSPWSVPPHSTTTGRTTGQKTTATTCSRPHRTTSAAHRSPHKLPAWME